MRYKAIYRRGQGLLAEYQEGVLISARDDGLAQENCAGPQVVRDIGPYKSMIDGSIIEGRKQHRDHLRAHGCEEVGNDTSHMNRQREAPKTSMRESISRRLGDMSDRQANQLLAQLRRGN